MTESIQDPSLGKKREQIREALDEFVWTPGCKREDKRAPVFDFSEQLAKAPPPPAEEPERTIVFAGLSEKEKDQAIRALEKQTGKEFDRKKKSLRRRKSN